MDRMHFLKRLGLFPLSLSLTSLTKFGLFENALDDQVMPMIFLGHGSPMNAIEENEFVEGFRAIKQQLPTPNAVLCISAHWETDGTFVTAMPQPRTIHDFGGFPQALFDVVYPAPGHPELAKEIQQQLTATHIALDHQWGLDHGTWSVVKHLYPEATIPVLQLSLNYKLTPEEHYALAKNLSFLRKKGVLIVGSGNMVHNLGLLAWDKMRQDNFAFDWALEANQRMKNFILTTNHEPLIQFRKQGSAFDLAIPSTEHFLPLLYVLAMQSANEKVTIFNDKAVGGALTMTSILIH